MPDGGHVINVEVEEDVYRLLTQPSPYSLARRPLPPLSRRNQLKVRLYSWRWRLMTCVEVLRGQHECRYD